MYARTLLPIAAFAALLALPQVALASGVGVTAPATSPVGQSMTVHLAGTADEDGLAVMGVVRQQACPATHDEALALQGPRENEAGTPRGSFSLDMNLITSDQASGQDLSGPMNVCVYLFRTSDNTTVAANSTSVVLTNGAPSGGFGIQIPAHERMSGSGTLRLSATCPGGCTLKARAGNSHAVTKHLGASSSPVTIKVPLSTALQHRVKQARRKHKTVSVTVTASATPSSGSAKTASRTVKVS
jgi:hypothetical protein